MTSLIWISFDLGVRGDYESLFQFLDMHKAQECGDNLALLRYEWKKDLVSELQRDLDKTVSFGSRSRVYVIFPGAKGAYKGRFIKGARRSPPWAGYAASDTQEEDADE